MKIENIISLAIENTNQEHIEMTEYGIYKAPEYLITVNISKELQKLDNIAYTYMEWKTKDLLESDNLEINNIRNGKADICVVFEDNTNALIEVKNTITQIGAKLNSIHKDIERIGEFILNANDFFNIGYVCFIVMANTQKYSLDKANKFISGMIKKFKNLQLVATTTSFQDNDNNYFTSVVIEITNLKE